MTGIHAQFRQLVICTGPRCLRTGQVGALLEAGDDLRRRHPEWSLGSYPCLARCPSAPNALIRVVAGGADRQENPGYRDLDDATPLLGVTRAAIDALPNGSAKASQGAAPCEAVGEDP